VNTNHFDGYISGPETLTGFEPLEPVPGLNKGGWHDAGDYDLRVESQMGTVWLLSLMVEEFGLDYDATTIDQQRKLVEIHQPDGRNDALQQALSAAQSLYKLAHTAESASVEAKAFSAAELYLATSDSYFKNALLAYGVNRADWSFIPGGVISGTALIRPDLPELKIWPFFWQQTEYVMGGGAANYMFLVLAADATYRDQIKSDQ
jgi:hypothetical protein